MGVICPELSRPANGNVSLMERFPGYTATFSCHPGFQLSGARFLTCQSNGTWDNVPPTCHNITGKNTND